MKRKLYSIGELIDENMRLKKQIERMKINQLTSTIYLLEMAKDGKTLDLEKAIRGFKQALEEIQ